MSGPALSVTFTGELYLWRARTDSWTFVDTPVDVEAGDQVMVAVDVLA